MDWLANMQAWQALPPEKRREQAWAQVPTSVAASMAFEGDPVSLEWIKALHQRARFPSFQNQAHTADHLRSGQTCGGPPDRSLLESIPAGPDLDLG